MLIRGRVAEINLGIICACVPVVFPLFKSIAQKTGSGSSFWRQYILKPLTPSKFLTTTGTNASATNHELPKVASGRLNTLLSFIRGSQKTGETSRGNITVERTTDIEMAPYSELRSVDVDYHAYLTNGHQGSERNLIGNTVSAQRG